jgi:hypothetical protein
MHILNQNTCRSSLNTLSNIMAGSDGLTNSDTPCLSLPPCLLQYISKMRLSICTIIPAALLFLLQLNPVLASYSASPAQTVTVDTLPPASPTGGDSDPCAFTDRSSLLARVNSDAYSYNLSLLVETCASVCDLVYGTGNPDISGIGVSCFYPAFWLGQTCII